MEDDNINENKILGKEIDNIIWLSVSESAKLGGIESKTIRRAIQSQKLKYKIIKNRYLIDLSSLIIFLNSSIKLKNKLKLKGLGQYVMEWKK